MNFLRTVQKDVACHLILPDNCAIFMFPTLSRLSILVQLPPFPCVAEPQLRADKLRGASFGKGTPFPGSETAWGWRMVLHPAGGHSRADTTDHTQGDEYLFLQAQWRP